jgi:anti-sigma factor RsiW
MNETLICGDHEALVSYLYNECAPGERRAISAHVAICSACAEELMALGATREQLALWAPPDVQLGFRIVSDVPQAAVLRPARWWRQPMPAWAQAAAAAIIFATGLTLGVLRGATPVPSTTVAASTPNTSVTRADLVALEQRLRSDLSQSHPAATPVAATPAVAQILQQVRTMIDDSEQRQRRELALRTAEMTRDFDAQRNDDLARIERTLGQMDGTTGVEVAQQRQMLNYLMRVSQRGQ